MPKTKVKFLANSVEDWQRWKAAVEKRLDYYKELKKLIYRALRKTFIPLGESVTCSNPLGSRSIHFLLMHNWSELSLQLAFHNWKDIPAKDFVEMLHKFAKKIKYRVADLRFTIFFGKEPVLECYLVPENSSYGRNDPKAIYFRCFGALANCEIEYVEKTVYEIASTCIDPGEEK